MMTRLPSKAALLKMTANDREFTLQRAFEEAHEDIEGIKSGRIIPYGKTKAALLRLERERLKRIEARAAEFDISLVYFKFIDAA